MTDSYYKSFVTRLRVPMSVGMHPWEKHPERKQIMLISVELYTHTITKDTFMDYDPIHQMVRGWADRPHTETLETLLWELQAKCFENPDVQACRITLEKPDIFHDADAAGIELYQTRTDYEAMQ